MKSTKIAIVGCGFLGTSLAKYLKDFFSVTTFDVFPQPKLLQNYNIEHKICDITNFNQLQEKIETTSIIIHTVATNLANIPSNSLAYDINIKGIQNVCETVSKNESIRGMILCSSWHVYGDQDISGDINEDYGYRPDKVEERAKIYALSKVIQDCIVRFFDKKQDEKIFGAFRLGTILDYNMRNDTAAGKFITKALAGDDVTPYKHSMNKPMFFVSMNDVCKSFKSFIDYILTKDKKNIGDVDHIFNLAYPTPVKIIDLANSIIDSVKKNSNGKILPKLSIVDLGIEETDSQIVEKSAQIDISKIKECLNISSLTKPEDVIDQIIRSRLDKSDESHG